MNKPIDILRFCLRHIPDDENEGSVFYFKIDGDAFTYGWCSNNSDGDGFTTKKSEARYFNLFAHTVSALDPSYKVDIDFSIDEPYFFCKAGQKLNKHKIVLKTLVGNKYSKHEVVKILPPENSSDVEGSIAILAEGEHIQVGMDGSIRIVSEMSLN